MKLTVGLTGAICLIVGPFTGTVSPEPAAMLALGSILLCAGLLRRKPHGAR